LALINVTISFVMPLPFLGKTEYFRFGRLKLERNLKKKYKSLYDFIGKGNVHPRTGQEGP
jgi:hypothetical protein